MTSPSLNKAGVKGVDLPFAVLEVLVRQSRVASKLLGGHGRQHRDSKPGGMCEAGDHVAVTAVVAPAAHDDDPVGHGPACAEESQAPPPRPVSSRYSREFPAP